MILTHEDFPKFQNHIHANWAPIILEPLIGAYEHLVIGVVAYRGNEFHVEKANSLSRLQCFYGERAEMLLFVIEASLEEISSNLVDRGPSIIEQGIEIFSNVRIGAISKAEGSSLQRIALSWIENISSLHEARALHVEQAVERVLGVKAVPERLPSLIFEYVGDADPRLKQFFSPDIRDNNIRRKKKSVSGTVVDFSGERVAVNFGTLILQSRARSITHIKNKLWDLKVERDKDGMITRTHEMLVQCPDVNNPQLTKTQVDDLNETLQDLEKQADQEELRFETFNTIPEIGSRLIRAEAA